MSTWKGTRNSYSNGSCRVTWTLTAPRPGHAMDWRLAMSAGRRLGASKAGSGWTGSRGARGLQKGIARLDVPLAAGAPGGGPGKAVILHPPPPPLFLGPRRGKGGGGGGGEGGI